MKPSGTIVVIGKPHDPHVEAVRQYLRHQVLIVDPTIPQTLTYRWNGLTSTPHVVFGGQERWINAVWVRDAKVSTAFLEPFKPLLPTAVWLSPYEAIERLKSLPYQQMLAHRAGLQVPITSVTSDAAEARAFLQDQSSALVSWVDKPSQQRFITDPNDPALTNAMSRAIILQEVLQTSHGLQVTVVGDNVFPAIILDERKEAILERSKYDWQAGLEAGQFNAVAYTDFPANVAQACIKMVKLAGLKMGVIRLFFTKRRQAYFVSLSHHDSWLVAAHRAKLPIAKAIAALLDKTDRD